MSEITLTNDYQTIPDGCLFVKLKGANITRVPHIPRSVIILELISCTEMSSLPELPETLGGLYVWDTPIHSLSFPLPSRLSSLVIHNAKLGDPFHFPDTLETLRLTGSVIPPVDTLPPKLVSFRYGYNRNIRVLPTLPDTLTNLDISETSITSIPRFPPNLVSFWYEKTPIPTLPDIPASLTLIVSH